MPPFAAHTHFDLAPSDPTVAGDDYVAGPYIVQFSQGITLPNSACINITTIDDDNVEGDQAFTVSISSVSLPNSVTLLDPSMQTATLTDNDGKLTYS